MRSSTRLLIDVFGFGFNFSGAILFALLKAPMLVAVFVVCMFLSYQGIYRVMTFLDACDTANGERNEDKD